MTQRELDACMHACTPQQASGAVRARSLGLVATAYQRPGGGGRDHSGQREQVSTPMHAKFKRQYAFQQPCALSSSGRWALRLQ
jgi:hypothetical protein